MSRPRRGLLTRAAVAWLSAWLAASVAAHEPTSDGGSRGSFSSDQLVTYRFAGSYPSFMTGAVTAGFETYYHDASAHNSLAPRLDYSSSGTARVFYRLQSTSPCSGRTGWIGCAKFGGTTAFELYVRDLAGHPDWGWYEASSSCSGIGVCFYMKRSILHELGHAIFSFGHDDQGEDDTVMASFQPAASATGWNRKVWQRCDQAASQLLWGARNVAGPIGECMDHVTGAGSNGLKTEVTLGASDTMVCVGESVNLSGTLSIAVNSNYGRLSGDPLGSRTVTIKRDGAVWVTRTTGSTTGNYSATASFSTAGSRAYVTSFPSEGYEALTGDTSPTVTATWSAPPC